MLSEEERQRIRQEELFRYEVRQAAEQDASRDTRSQKRLNFLNSPLGIWNLKFDRSPNGQIYMTRILSRVVPAVTEEHLRDGIKGYTQAFLDSFRRGVYRRDDNQLRQVAPIELQFDQFSAVDRFRRETWEKLYQTALANPAVASAIDDSSIAEPLGAHTTDTAQTLLDNHPLEPLRSFVSAHVRADGSLCTNLTDLDTQIEGVGSQA